jgi:phosphotransferase system  glucose/maltose/N-acetylglucosamine-specific IIC component
MRQTATGALAAGLLGGISEPSLYGIHLRFKRIYPRMLVGCFVGGLIIGVAQLFGAKVSSGLGPFFGHLVFLIALLARPQGLLGKAQR